MTSIAGVHKPIGNTDTWLTPKALIEAMPEFDMDPCAAPEPRPWPTAKRHVCLPVNGLTVEWTGRVWCNPPYGLEAAKWLRKMAEHGNGIALVFARTETAMFFSGVWPKATAILFIAGRLTFCDRHGVPAAANSGGPSCLIAYGAECAKLLRDRSSLGRYIELNKTIDQLLGTEA